MSQLAEIRLQIAALRNAGREPVRALIHASIWTAIKAEFVGDRTRRLDWPVTGRDVIGLPVDITFKPTAFEIICRPPDAPVAG